MIPVKLIRVSRAGQGATSAGWLSKCREQSDEEGITFEDLAERHLRRRDNDRSMSACPIPVVQGRAISAGSRKRAERVFSMPGCSLNLDGRDM